MQPFDQMERAAKDLADAREKLYDLVGELNRAVEQIQRQRMRALKAAVNAAAEKEAALLGLIQVAGPGAFVKPRSVVMHGQRFGYRKGVGGVEFDDAEQVAKLVRRHFPEQFDVLVKTTYRPLKGPLAQLSVAELKKIACTVEDSGDVPFITATDSAVDKLVAKLIESAAAEDEETQS